MSKWIISENIPRNASDKLLKILTESNITGLPKSSQTLLKTPSLKIIPTPVLPGEYFHYGIQSYLANFENQFLKSATNIIIDLATDGLPLFKSASSIKLWPILASFPNLKNIQPFLVGAYVQKNQRHLINF